MAAAKLKNVHENVKDSESLAGFLVTEKDALHVLMFWAAWDEPSKPTGALDVALSKLAELHPGVLFAKVRSDGQARTRAVFYTRRSSAPSVTLTPARRARRRSRPRWQWTSLSSLTSPSSPLSSSSR